MSIADFWGATETQQHKENLFTAEDAEYAEGKQRTGIEDI